MSISHFFLDISRKLFGNMTFTIRHGIAKGFKRRYGLGFVPKWGDSQEDLFMREKNFENQTIFDVGAYVGLYSVFFASKSGPNGKVISFEPNPANFAELNYNLHLNGFTTTRTIMAAVGEKPGKLEMHVSPHLTSRGSLNPEWESAPTGNAQKLEVEVVTIDGLMEKGDVPTPDFIKIDVEAFELPVLRGARETLRKYHPTLLVEIHGPLTKEILDELFQHGYTIMHLELGQIIPRGTIPSVMHGHLYCEKK